LILRIPKKQAMNKSDLSYLITVIFFAIGFVGFAFSANPMYYFTWLTALALGVISFFIRIVRGDD